MFFLQILLNSLVIGTQVLLLALALYLIYSVSKVFHLALGAIGTSVAYGLYWTIAHQIYWPLGIVFALIVAVILGMISYWLLEPFVKKQEHLLALLVSFSFLVVLESLVSIMFGSDGKSIIQGVLPTLNFWGLHLTVPGLGTICLGIFTALAALVVVIKTSWGRILRGISENTCLVSSLMINSPKVRFLTFIIGSIIAGTIVVLSSVNTALTPRGSFDLLIMAFIALLVGGIKDIKGTVVASFVVSLIPELIIGLSSTDWHFSPSWKMFFVFILAVALLVWRPQGLFAKQQRAG